MGCGFVGKAPVTEIVGWACGGETEEDPSVHYYVPGVPLSKPELIRAILERNFAIRLGRILIFWRPPTKMRRASRGSLLC